MVYYERERPKMVLLIKRTVVYYLYTIYKTYKVNLSQIWPSNQHDHT